MLLFVKKSEPDLKIRGFMLDISRNKVAKISTIKYIIDIMSDLKMNHFELYVEGLIDDYVMYRYKIKTKSKSI